MPRWRKVWGAALRSFLALFLSCEVDVEECKDSSQSSLLHLLWSSENVADPWVLLVNRSSSPTLFRQNVPAGMLLDFKKRVQNKKDYSEVKNFIEHIESLEDSEVWQFGHSFSEDQWVKPEFQRCKLESLPPGIALRLFPSPWDPAWLRKADEQVSVCGKSFSVCWFITPEVLYIGTSLTKRYNKRVLWVLELLEVLHSPRS